MRRLRTLPALLAAIAALISNPAARAEVTTRFPQVVPLYSEVNFHGQAVFGPGRCTGVFISAKLLLTAAHCVRDFKGDMVGGIFTRPTDMRGCTVPDQTATPKQAYILAPGGFFGPKKIHPKRIFVSPSAERVLRSSLNLDEVDQDLAILEFAEPWPRMSPVSTTPPAVGDPVASVGYGNHDEGAAGVDGLPVKHLGKNKLSAVEYDALTTDGSASSCGAPGPHTLDWATCPGDSGGPLFNAAGEVIGITLVSEEPYAQADRSNPRMYSHFVDLTSPRARAFITGTLNLTGSRP